MTDLFINVLTILVLLGFLGIGLFGFYAGVNLLLQHQSDQRPACGCRHHLAFHRVGRGCTECGCVRFVQRNDTFALVEFKTRELELELQLAQAREQEVKTKPRWENTETYKSKNTYR